MMASEMLALALLAYAAFALPGCYEDAADARLRAQRSNELFQSDAAPKRLLELTAAQHAAEIVEAGGLRRRLRAHRFRRWLDRTASGAAAGALTRGTI